MPNNIAIKITAETTQLTAQLAVAKAELSGFQKQLGTLAKDAQATGIGQGISQEMLATSESVAAAQAKVVSIKSALKETEAVGAPALAEVGSAAETTATNFGVVAYEAQAVADELSSGRWRRAPSSLGRLLIEGLRIPPMMVGIGAAAAVAAAGLGYLEYKALEAEKEVDDLTTAFQLTGRGAEVGASGVQYMLDFLNSVPNASSDATQAFVQFAATSEQVNLGLAYQVGQLLPDFEKAYGKKAPEAAGKLLASLSDLSVKGFRKLDQTMLNLSPTEYEQIERLIEIGDQAKATSEIMQILAHRTGSYIKSNGDRIYDIEHKMSEVVKNAAFREGIHINFDPKSIQSIEQVKKVLSAQGGFVSQGAIGELDKLEKEIRYWRALEAKDAKGQADQKYKARVQAAEQLNERLDKQAQLTKELKGYQAGLAQAETRHDRHGIKEFSLSIAETQKELDALKKHHDDHKNKASNPFKGTGFSNAGSQAIAQAREAISAINADQKLGDKERINEINKTYAQLLNSGKLNAAQRIAVETEMNRNILEVEKRAEADKRQIASDNARTKIELAQTSYQEYQSNLASQVAAGKISHAQEVSDLTRVLLLMENLQLTAINKSIEGYSKDSVAYARAQNQKLLVTEHTQARIAELKARNSKNEVRDFQRTHQELLGFERNFIDGMITGQQNLGQMTEQFALRSFENIVVGEAKMWTERLLLQKTGNAQGKAMSLEATLTQIGHDAAKAYSGAYSALVGIPIVGPILAPIAATAAEVAVFGAEALASAEGGQMQVPYDGQLTQLHKNEMVIPAHIANPLRSFAVDLAAGKSSSSSASFDGASPDVHFHVHANDTRGVQAFFNEHGESIARTLNRVWKTSPNLHPSAA